ncbi:hypothetical protein C802_01653 [Phocaeicola sartorii]|jgi:hypothetical protein|uniref:Uncharacterized protein n=1 Tax=Phocaeicola sartorii TaxID=671267 RepID=R9IA45_9BACT|nr:hypothetical protein C802_01653 [Phocaeicola sartorii]
MGARFLGACMGAVSATNPEVGWGIDRFEWRLRNTKENTYL